MLMVFVNARRQASDLLLKVFDFILFLQFPPGCHYFLRCLRRVGVETLHKYLPAAISDADQDAYRSLLVSNRVGSCPQLWGFKPIELSEERSWVIIRINWLYSLRK